jgi:hypothetical protein
MTIMRDLIADTRRLAYGSMADQLNFLSAEALPGAADLDMSMDVDNITPGMVLSCGLNVYYVIATNPSARRVTVYPGYDNSRNDALPVGSPVMIRPRVTDWLLFGYVNDVVKALSSTTHGLYREGSWEDPNLNQVWGTYPIPADAADMTNLIRVQTMYFYSTDLWVDVPMNLVDWQPERGIVRIKGAIPMGFPIKFDYKAPFKPAAGLTDDVHVDMGLPDTMHDIPALGAAVRLLRTTENRRSQIHNQGDSRRAGEAQPGMNTSAATDFNREFRQRVNDEYARLVNRNPFTQVFP